MSITKFCVCWPPLLWSHPTLHPVAGFSHCWIPSLSPTRRISPTTTSYTLSVPAWPIRFARSRLNFTALRRPRFSPS
ncbi:hypothetical protein C8F04DRAFT_1147485 [Mycena alexandri]|uniref:Uncharacterized protein n=1 Tax=Mycena alexandri TaxID=1745969 RepID=A0AAD6RZU9_9AGAR|nr:hypothetical protein C8F04DRAFT_1153791 [Mycena alexandri]KAJ7019414.1 hypothetical protein C8F04DRAFT_1147485 [Mycena alexandri]